MSLDGNDAFRAFHARALAAFPKTKVVLLDAIESGDRCSIVARFEGETKAPATTASVVAFLCA